MKLVDIWNWIKKGPNPKRPIRQTTTRQTVTKLKKPAWEKMTVARLKVKLIVWLVGLFLIGLFVIGVFLSYKTYQNFRKDLLLDFQQDWLNWLYIPLAITCLIIPIREFVRGFVSVPEEQRWIYETLGKYWATKGPGLIWVLKLLTKKRTFVSVWEQRYPIFEEEIKIDFMNGSAIPRRAYINIICNEGDRYAPSRMVYGIKDVKGATVDLVESAYRTYCNKLDISKGIQLGRGESDILEKLKKIKDGRKLVENLQEKVKEWGLRIEKFTIEDWDLDPAVIEARTGVTKGEMAVKEAKFRLHQRALESGGMHAEIKKMLVDEYKYPPDRAEEIAENYTRYWKGTETGRIIDLQTGKSGGLADMIAQVVAVVDATKKALGGP